MRRDAQQKHIPTTPRTVLVRSAWRVSALSATWTTATSSLAIALGMTQGSVTLIAFGAVGYLDALGSVVLVVHFLSSTRRQALAEQAERWAHWIIGAGLVTVGVAAVVVSAVRLIGGQDADGSAVSIALASVSVLTLALLSHRKQVIATAIDSAPLRADGQLSGVGTLQAVVVLAGTLITTEVGWRWVDPAAATAVGIFAIVLGCGTLRDALRTAKIAPHGGSAGTHAEP